jgi:hypothetical protein
LAGKNNSSRDSKKKGFAGLSSMVSDVDAVIADASTPIARPVRESPRDTDSSIPVADSKPVAHEPSNNSQESTEFSSGTKTIIGFAVAVAIIIVIIAAMDGNEHVPASRTSGATYTPSLTNVNPPEPRKAAPTRPTEQEPPLGRNNVLAGAQIRYCVAENIRIDAAAKVVDNNIEAHVDRFNGMVEDYNSRCAEFRYREGSLQSAERAMEPYREELEQEGRWSIASSGSR